MSVSRKIRVLKELLTANEALGKAMLAILQEMEEDLDDNDPPSVRPSEVITIPPEEAPPARESRRPTVALPRVGGDFFERYVHGIVLEARTDQDKVKVRALIQTGIDQRLLDDAAVLRLRVQLGD